MLFGTTTTFIVAELSRVELINGKEKEKDNLIIVYGFLLKIQSALGEKGVCGE